jgi:hypothetical protein
VCVCVCVCFRFPAPRQREERRQGEGGSERGGWSEHKKKPKNKGTRESGIVGDWTAVARTELCRVYAGFRIQASGFRVGVGFRV